MNFTSVGIFENDSQEELIVYLEIRCEEIHVAPGLSFELFIEDIPEALPINVGFNKNCLQIYPHRAAPEWRIEFQGQRIKPGYPTILKDLLAATP